MSDITVNVPEETNQPPKEATNPPATPREKIVPETDQPEANLTENLLSCIFYLCVFSIFFIIFIILLAICAIPMMIFYIAALPLLILSFLVTRALQILWHRDDYHKAVQLKLYIRLLMFISTSCSVAGLAIFYYGIAKHIPSFKLAVIVATPLENWVILLFVIYGFYLLHFVLLLCIFKFVPNIPLDHYERGFNVPEHVLEMIDCLILWLIVSQVEKRVPAFKADKIHGLYTRKWIVVTIISVAAYNLIVLCTRLIIAVKVKKERKDNDDNIYNTIKEKILPERYVKYCAIGLKQSIDFILSSILFLLIWVFYFGPHLEETLKAERVFHVGTISCATLLVSAILWFIKTYLLLLWEVRTFYSRLEKRIVEEAKQLYYLGIVGCGKHDIFNLIENDNKKNHSNDDKEGGSSSQKENKKKEGGFKSFCLKPFPVWEDKKKPLAKMAKKVQEDLLITENDPRLSFYELRQIAYYFLQARETLADDKYTVEIMERITTSMEQQITNGDFKQGVTEALAPKQKGIDYLFHFDKQIKPFVKEDKQIKPPVQEDKQIKPPVKEDKQIEPPVQEDKQKEPPVKEHFSLEDIQNWMMVVRTIGVWLTTFSKVDIQEEVDTKEVTYPNSQLFTKTITNHKTNFDWNDRIEFEVASVNIETKENKENIEKYSESSNTPSLVLVSRAGNDVTKINVTFRRKNKDKETSTYSQRLKEKQKLKSKLLTDLQDKVTAQATTQFNCGSADPGKSAARKT